MCTIGVSAFMIFIEINLRIFALDIYMTGYSLDTCLFLISYVFKKKKFNYIKNRKYLFDTVPHSSFKNYPLVQIYINQVKFQFGILNSVHINCLYIEKFTRINARITPYCFLLPVYRPFDAIVVV